MRWLRSHPRLVQAAKLFVGILIVAFLLYRYDLRAVAHAMAQADPWRILAAFAFGVAAIVCYARQHVAVMALSASPVGTLAFTRILFEIRFYTLFLPAAASAVVKWHKIKKAAENPRHIFALLVVARISHSIVLLCLAAAAVPFDPRFPWPELAIPLIAAAAMSVAIALLLCLPPVHTAAARWLDRGAARLPQRMRDPMKRYSNALHVLGNTIRPAYMLPVTGYALAGIVLETAQDYCIARAINLDLSILPFLWLRGVIILCQSVPFTVAGLGVREVGMVAIMVHYAVPEEQALAFSFLFFIVAVGMRGAVGAVMEAVETGRAYRFQ